MNFFKTPLEKALSNWQKNKGDLDSILGDLKFKKIQSKRDAQAIINVLKQYHIKENGPVDGTSLSPLFSLTPFFRQLETREAYDEFNNNGIPELTRIFNEGKTIKKFNSNLPSILEIMAIYENDEGIETVLKAAKDSYAADDYIWWSNIFRRFGENHIHKGKVLEAFNNKLPDNLIALSFLDFVNKVAIYEGIENHPFNSAEGIHKLNEWLNNHDDSLFAHSSAATIPFIKNETDRKELLKLAFNYPEIGVKMEAAWVAAKLGDDTGLQFLKNKASEPIYSRTACEFLKELNKENEIPEIVSNEDFQALVNMCSWLSSPYEFGRPPDEIVQYDKRELFWPPTNDKRKVWLFKYTYNQTNDGEEAKIGISMVGSVTFALGDVNGDLRPEEVYGLHCCWELKWNADTRAPQEISPKAGIEIISMHNEGFK